MSLESILLLGFSDTSCGCLFSIGAAIAFPSIGYGARATKSAATGITSEWIFTG